jgi:hypothetical protein
MPDMSEKPGTPAHVLVTCWLIVVIAGGTSAAYNLYDSLTGQLPVGLGILLGVVPVLLAAMLAHVVAYHKGAGPVLKGITITVMAAALGMSTFAIATVLWAERGALSIVLGAILDTATILALHIILAARSRAAEEASALAAADERVRAAGREAAEARERAAGQARAAAEAAGLAAGRDAEIARLRAELEAELRRAADRKPPRASARKPARKDAAVSARKQAAISGAEAGGEGDLDAEAQALQILADDPGISGSRLGPMVGRSDSWGRDLKRRLARSVPGPDSPAGDQ